MSHNAMRRPKFVVTSPSVTFFHDWKILNGAWKSKRKKKTLKNYNLTSYLNCLITFHVYFWLNYIHFDIISWTFKTNCAAINNTYICYSAFKNPHIVESVEWKLFFWFLNSNSGIQTKDLVFYCNTPKSGYIFFKNNMVIYSRYQFVLLANINFILNTLKALNINSPYELGVIQNTRNCPDDRYHNPVYLLTLRTILRKSKLFVRGCGFYTPFVLSALYAIFHGKQRLANQQRRRIIETTVFGCCRGIAAFN